MEIFCLGGIVADTYNVTIQHAAIIGQLLIYIENEVNLYRKMKLIYIENEVNLYRK